MDERKQFTDREKAAYEPGPCQKGHERRKTDVVWRKRPPDFKRAHRAWLIERVDCPVCSRPPVEEGDEWRDEIE